MVATVSGSDLFDLRTVATLPSPWSMVFLPDGQMLVTERPPVGVGSVNPTAQGHIRLVTPAGDVSIALTGVPENAGTLDIVLDPNFAQNQTIYFSYIDRDASAAREGRGADDLRIDPAAIAVAKAVLDISDPDAPKLTSTSVIWHQAPDIASLAGSGQPGGEMTFSPDGKYLFITAGDRQEFEPVQSLGNTLGKTIRIHPDGTIPVDNPYVNVPGARPEIWSTGHRNSYGLVFDEQGVLWENEMGPKGGDELNVLRPGANYGWPNVSYGNNYDGSPLPKPASGDGYVDAALQWTPVIAPSSMISYSGDAFPDWKDDLVISGLQSRGLVIVDTNGTSATEVMRIDLGARTRDVVQAPDGSLWVLYDAADGRLVQLQPRSQVTEVVVASENAVHLTSDSDWTISYTLGENARNVVLDSAGPAAITGSKAANRLTGNAGHDFLFGLAGDDTLVGKRGDDRLEGGDGNDIAIINALFTSATITPTVNGLAVKTADGMDMLGGIETIRFNDRDVSVANYLIQGSSGDEVLTGTSGSNWLFGYAGNDRLDGKAGADTMIGGSGDDTYYIDNAGDRVTEQGKGGDDLVVSSVGYTTPENVETLQLAPGANGTIVAGDAGTKLVGNDLANVLQGSTADDVLDGRAGADAMTGKAGDDTYYVDNAGDRVIEQSSGGVDQIWTTVDYTLPSNVEVLSANADATVALKLNANAADNRIALGAAGGSAFGLGGNDILVSGRAANLLDGGSGFDTAVISYSRAATPTGPKIAFSGRGDVVVITSDNVTRLHDVEAVDVSLSDGSSRLYTAHLREIDAQYVAFGGRHANANELGVWSRLMQAGTDVGTVKTAILGDPLGKPFIETQISQAYLTYGSRSPNSSEMQVWQGNLRGNGYDVGSIKSAILNDPLGKSYIDAQVTQAYQTYASRAPVSNELQVWEGILRTSGFDFDVVGAAILNDPLGRGYIDARITQSYQAYAGRLPIGNELQVWQGILHNNGMNFDAVRTAILGDPVGRAYIDGQITQSYQTYAGRSPAGNELQVWKDILHGNGLDFDSIKAAILQGSIGDAYIDAQVTQAYQTYAGRAPVGNELDVWQGILRGNDFDFGAVKAAIMAEPLGDDHATKQIDTLYQRYFDRVPTAAEQAEWHSRLGSDADYTVFRASLLSDAGSATSTRQLTGTRGSDTFVVNKDPGHLVIAGFDPQVDKVSLRTAGFGRIDPLDPAHAREFTLDGQQNVLIALDTNHDLLLHDMTLAQLSANNFVF
jgi:glucose/arabinose dehydrogenase